MAGLVTAIPWRDENRSLFPGGMDYLDLSGTGIGPWVPIAAVIGAGGVLLAINADGSLNVVSGSAAVTTVTDKSFTTGAGSATVIAANASRLGYRIENPVKTTLNLNGDSIFVDESALAVNSGSSFEVTSGGYWPPPGHPPWKGAVSVLGGAAGIKVTAKEYT